MRKVFLDELPRKNKNINWKQSVGYVVKFIYDDIEGDIEIIDLTRENRTSVLTLKILETNKFFKMNASHFKECKLGNFLMIYTNEFKINIGEEIRDNGRNLNIIDRKYNYVKYNNHSGQNLKLYKYHCNKCGNEDWMEESNLMKGKSCNVCCVPSKKVLQGYNDIATTDPWMIDLGVSEEDAKTHTHTSAENVMVTCPVCGRRKKSKICNIYNRKSINCSCGDGVSYPEKFLISLLDQLEIKYQHDNYWIKDKRYDFYFELNNKKYIIETHGQQHYENKTFEYVGGRNLDEEQQNDLYKKQLALNNGINEYIVLDCRESNLELIKNSVLQSKLNNVFDLSKIDWLKCEEFALSNRVKEICDYWNNKKEWENVKDLSKIFNLNRNTIVIYLKKGTKLNWCKYNAQEESHKGRIKTGITKRKPVKILKDDKCIGIFESISELAEQSEKLFGVKLLNSEIGSVCNGKRKTHKGFTFKYVESSDMDASKQYRRIKKDIDSRDSKINKQ